MYLNTNFTSIILVINIYLNKNLSKYLFQMHLKYKHHFLSYDAQKAWNHTMCDFVIHIMKTSWAAYFYSQIYVYIWLMCEI